MKAEWECLTIAVGHSLFNFKKKTISFERLFSNTSFSVAGDAGLQNRFNGNIRDLRLFSVWFNKDLVIVNELI